MRGERGRYTRPFQRRIRIEYSLNMSLRTVNATARVCKCTCVSDVCTYVLSGRRYKSISSREPIKNFQKLVTRPYAAATIRLKIVRKIVMYSAPPPPHQPRQNSNKNVSSGFRGFLFLFIFFFLSFLGTLPTVDILFPDVLCAPQCMRVTVCG